MEKIHEFRLHKNFAEICDRIDCKGTSLPALLLQENVLTAKDVECLSSFQTVYDANKWLLLTLPRRGKRAYSAFITALEASHNEIHDLIIKIIETFIDHKEFAEWTERKTLYQEPQSTPYTPRKFLSIPNLRETRKRDEWVFKPLSLNISREGDISLEVGSQQNYGSCMNSPPSYGSLENGKYYKHCASDETILKEPVRPTDTSTSSSNHSNNTLSKEPTVRPGSKCPSNINPYPMNTVDWQHFQAIYDRESSMEFQNKYGIRKFVHLPVLNPNSYDYYCDYGRELLKFASACLNSDRNGVIYFGFDGGKPTGVLIPNCKNMETKLCMNQRKLIREGFAISIKHLSSLYKAIHDPIIKPVGSAELCRYIICVNVANPDPLYTPLPPLYVRLPKFQVAFEEAAFFGEEELPSSILFPSTSRFDEYSGNFFNHTLSVHRSVSSHNSASLSKGVNQTQDVFSTSEGPCQQGTLPLSIPPAQSMPSLPLHYQGKDKYHKPNIEEQIDERTQRHQEEILHEKKDGLDLARHVCSCSDISSLVGHGVCEEEIPQLRHHLSLADINLEDMNLVKSGTSGFRGYIKKMFSKKRKPSIETIDKKKLKKKRFKWNYEVL